MQGFRLTINLKDKTCRWHGMEAGKTTLVELNPHQRSIVIHIAGSSYWSGLGQRSYAPAKFEVYHISGLSGVSENSVEIVLGAQKAQFSSAKKGWPGAPDMKADNIVHLYHED